MALASIGVLGSLVLVFGGAAPPRTRTMRVAVDSAGDGAGVSLRSGPKPEVDNGHDDHGNYIVDVIEPPADPLLHGGDGAGVSLKSGPKPGVDKGHDDHGHYIVDVIEPPADPLLHGGDGAGVSLKSGPKPEVDNGHNDHGHYIVDVIEAPADPLLHKGHSDLPPDGGPQSTTTKNNQTQQKDNQKQPTTTKNNHTQSKTYKNNEKTNTNNKNNQKHTKKNNKKTTKHNKKQSKTTKNNQTQSNTIKTYRNSEKQSSTTKNNQIQQKHNQQRRTNSSTSKCLEWARRAPKPPYFLTAVLLVRIYKADKANLTNREMKMWLEYLRYAGFEHVYVYDAFVYEEEAVLETLKPFQDDGYVTYVDWHTHNPYTIDGTQVAAYQDCINNYKGENEWQAAIDIDEYPFSPRDTSPGFLYRYMKDYSPLHPDVSELTLQNFLYLGKPLEKEELMIERLLRRTPKPGTDLVKPIYKPKNVRANVHHNGILTGRSMNAPSEELRMNHYWGARLQNWGEDTPEILKKTILDDEVIQPIITAFKDCESYVRPYL